MITITINGKAITLEEPVSVLEAAEANGIHIPHLCRHPLLELHGGCRMCLVEVERMSRLQTSCSLAAADGMSIKTETPDVVKARKAMLEFLLINHPLQCPECDKAGECRLQDYTYQYGAVAGRFKEQKLEEPEGLDDPLIVRNMERCIKCTRCVRMCHGVQGASAIAVTGRGARTFIKPFSEGRFECEYCGNCIVVCPVGSLMSRLHRYAYRPWQTDREVLTVCPYCGVGCSMAVQVRGEAVQRVMPREGVGVNNGLLCARGFFGYEYVASADRLTTPLVKEDGKLRPASWDEALSRTADGLRKAYEQHGGGAIAGIASGRCTDEDNYIFQKLMRAAFRTNNIDSLSRLGYLTAQEVLEDMLGEGVSANRMSWLREADAVLVAGGDPTQINPVLGITVRDAYRKGSNVVALGWVPGLHYYKSVGLNVAPANEVPVLAALLSGLLEKRRLRGEAMELEKEITDAALPGIGDIEGICSADDLLRARDLLAKGPSVSIVVGPGLMANPTGLFLIGAIAYLLEARVYLLSERPNEQGLIDMGCTPDRLPGGVAVGSEGAKRFEEAWGAKLPDAPGLGLMDIISAARAGSIKALYVMGENPAFNLPDGKSVREALEKLEFLVVQDIFMTETAEMADVVLPANCWAEKEGTFVNLERRMQVLRQAVPGKGIADWRILARLGKMLGVGMPYSEAEDVMAEIASVSPLHEGLGYGEIERGNGLWPYKGTPAKRAASRKFKGLYRREAATVRQAAHVGTERPLFHSGTLSRKSRALNGVCPEAVARMNEKTAQGHNLAPGDLAEVVSERGCLSLPVAVDPGVPDSVVFLSNNFSGKGVMDILGYDMEASTGAPALKTTLVGMKKVGI